MKFNIVILFIAFSVFFISCNDDLPKCTPGEYRCSREGNSGFCNSNHKWETEVCPNGCDSRIGRCISSSSNDDPEENNGTSYCQYEGAFRCRDNILQKCDSEEWKNFQECSSDQTCNSDKGTCENNSGNNSSENSSGCATDNLGKACTTDGECGACMICVNGGKCAKGCTSDSDCTLTGTSCNKKLARCLNIYASNRACDEANCPTGCCYATKGLTGLKCATGTNAETRTCGLCPQNQIYSPEDSKCVNTVCSMTTDDCPVLNSNSTNPPAKCYSCKSGELVCRTNSATSGCSAGVIINMTTCISSGKQCAEGVDECCSGMPCIAGYCY